MQEPISSFKSGYAAIIGMPNVGKSTLLNTLLNIKLSIVSSKPQTTRRRVLGILNKENYQVIFLDTPGILTPRYELQKRMMTQLQAALNDADLIILMVDVKSPHHPVPLNLQEINPQQKPVLLLFNKIDRIEKAGLLTLMDGYNRFYPFKAMIPISALNGDGVDEAEQEIIKLLPEHPPYYPPDVLSEHPERFFVAEFIREKIFEKYYEEIPYATEVLIEEFKERSRGKTYIRANILVERKSQKGIIIGKGGKALREAGQEARQEIEALLGHPVFLDLQVKVQENWRKDRFKLNRLGY